jgi:hypothetical protein
MNDENRVRRIAFAITAIFEGGGYHTYQNTDSGVISYGRFQFTLASGALGQVIQQYLEQSTTPAALSLRPYLPRILARDAALRTNTALRDLLVVAGSDPIMQAVQDTEAARSYWEPIKRIAINPRGLTTPLAWALLFDIGIHFGVGDGFLRIAEREFGVPERSRIGQNGLSEAQLILRVAELRKQSHDRQALRDNLPGLRVRGDFWLNLVRLGDWQLLGNSNGVIFVKGQPVQVRDPEVGPEPPPQPEEPAEPLRITPTDDRIRIRVRPVDGEQITTVSRGDVLTALETPHVVLAKLGVRDQWLHVRLSDGTQGYTAAWYFQLYQPPAPAPEPEPPPAPTPAPLPEDPLLVTPTENRIRVRTRPVNGDTIGFVSMGDVLPVLEPRASALAKVGAQGQWLYIRLNNGAEGYTAAWYFKVHRPTSPPAPVPAPTPIDVLMVTPTDDRVRIRARAINGEPIGLVSRGDVLRVLDPPAEALAKIGVKDEWLHIRTYDGLEGYTAAWFYARFDGPLPTKLIDANLTGVNLDLLNPIGRPDPARLGRMGWVRIPYNVSFNPDRAPEDPARYGNTDLDATYRRYHALLQAYARAGLKVLLVFTHQTFGEGAGYNWGSMSRDQWRDLSSRFANIAGRIASQYRWQNIVHAYQIWNEMDGQSGARASVPMPPEEYANLLTLSIRAIRAADSDVLVITGGHNSGPIRGIEYARRTLAAMPGDVRPDGIAAHPYGRGPSQSAPHYRPFGLIDDEVNAFAGVMPGWPVWITEWGILNQPDEPPDAVAEYAVDFIDRLKAVYSHKVAAAMWYAWGQGMDEGYGLVDAQGRPRGTLTDRYINL